jgi:sterol desaturase/sphingolipid hydroxylase (fatty acid hydroxylase superfamily)
MREIVLGGLMGPPVVSLVPAVHLWLTGTGRSTTAPPRRPTGATGWASVVVVLVSTDLYESGTNLGHRVAGLSRVHRHHHQFPNPTCDAVPVPDRCRRV